VLVTIQENERECICVLGVLVLPLFCVLGVLVLLLFCVLGVLDLPLFCVLGVLVLPLLLRIFFVLLFGTILTMWYIWFFN
jgi:hypothetical protein